MSLKVQVTTCRACLRESLECYFEINKQCAFSSDNKNLCEILNFCTHLKVQINDEFPQRICLQCVEDLQKTYEFLQKVLTSNKKLIDLKKRSKRNNEEIFSNNNNDSVKDPLENVSDMEDTLDNDSRSEIIKRNYEAEDSSSTLDNADNTVEDVQVDDNTLISNFSDRDDKNDSDFFKSVESQIFPQGRIKCKICGKSYFTSVGLEAHMDIHLPKRKPIAKTSLNVGGKYIKRKKQIKTDISDDEKSNDQDIKLTKDNYKIKQPKQKKIFPCEVCGKQMISASKLRYHMVMHTGEKDYLCTMCRKLIDRETKAYSTIYALKHHMRVHTGERPYECKFCGDRFLRPTTLKSHMRRHTGERPYGCDICGKRFIQHSSMATHMKLNHMDKTISCSYCDKKYARQTDLNTHLLSHSGDKPFGCQLCTSRFTRQSNLNKHMNQHHSNVNFGDRKHKNKAIVNEVSNDAVEQQIKNPSCSVNIN